MVRVMMLNHLYIFNFEVAMKKSIIRVLGFLACFVIVFTSFCKVFKYKYSDGIRQLNDFYELENDTIDVLCLGASFSFANINTGVLWDEYGIAAYNLGGSAQPIWNTYFYLEEALKTQHPQVIILESTCVTEEVEYKDNSNVIKNTFGLRWSPTKIKAIMASSPKEKWLDYLFSYIQYHNRYSDLSREDFYPLYHEKKLYMGFYSVNNVLTFDAPVIEKNNKKGKLSEKQLEYYKKILKLADEKNIPVLVIMSPMEQYNQVAYEKGNSIKRIAEEYGDTFVDYNMLYEAMDLDFANDCADISHLNPYGTEKFTKYLGKNLIDKYDIPDRRGDTNYSAWDASAKMLNEEMKGFKLRFTGDIKSYNSRVKDDGNLIFFIVDDRENTTGANLMLAKRISIDTEKESFMVERDDILWRDENDSDNYYCTYGVNHFAMKHIVNQDGLRSVDVLVNNKTMKVADGHANIVVYNEKLDEIVDSFAIDYANDCLLR